MDKFREYLTSVIIEYDIVEVNNTVTDPYQKKVNTIKRETFEKILKAYDTLKNK